MTNIQKRLTFLLEGEISGLGDELSSKDKMSLQKHVQNLEKEFSSLKKEIQTEYPDPGIVHGTIRNINKVLKNVQVIVTTR